jgi:uncharacterized damage-inducible protein DinB
MNQKLVGPFQAWKFHRGLALDILKSLSNEQLELTVGKNMGTLGQQFRHILKIELEYLQAIKTKKVSPAYEKPDKSVAESKEALVALFADIERRTEETLGSITEDPETCFIDWTHWGMDAMNLVDHMQALADHNNLHNGEIIVYARTHDIPFPKSWEPWGL